MTSADNNRTDDPKPTTFPTPWRDSDEAAHYCRVSRSTIDRAVRAGDGPRVHHVGARRMFHVDDLDAWIRRETERPEES